MSLHDRRDLPVTGATLEALDAFETALAELHCYRGDPLGSADRALAAAPGFAMAHALKGYLGVLATERPGVDLARGAVAALEPLPLSGRERGHLAALRALAAGDWTGGLAALDGILAEHPRDVLALQAAHVSSFFVGDARQLRDCVAKVRHAWDDGVPGHHAVLAMHSFGLEECGEYAAAERAGRRALELEPLDAWAHHAVAHVLEMQRRVDEGVEWMTSREPCWSPGNFFAIHNWWHLALFHLRRGEIARVLELYDRRVRAGGSKVVMDMLDASSLLWRLHVRGVDTGARFAELAEAWAPLAGDALYAFNDVHAAMAFLGAGRRDLLETLRATMRVEAARDDRRGNPAMVRDVGLPLVDGFTAFADGAPRRAAKLLEHVRPVAHRFGGSHAQREVIDVTLAEARRSAGME